MTSATLFREGPELDALLAELDAEHPGRVTVVDVEYGRAGGMLGFFAHRTVGVHYRLSDDETAPLPARGSIAGATEATSIEELLAAADSGDRGSRPAAAVTTGPADDEPDSSRVEFARMLLELATAKAAERQAVVDGPAPIPMPAAAYVTAPPVPTFTPPVPPPPPAFTPPPVVATPVPVIATVPTGGRTRGAGAHRAAVEAEANWGEYALRRRLVEIGAPVEWIPDGADNAYWVVEQLAQRVPTVRAAVPAPGEVIVVAGAGDDVLEAARAMATRLGLDPSEVHGAGCRGALADERRMEVWNAGATAAQYRTQASAPLIVAVALDGSSADAAERGRQVVRALVPDRVHAVVDAGRKTADARRTIAALPHVHSLFVTGAARTASPASVWEIGVPIEMLDGRPATQGSWAALLIDALAALDES